MALKLKLVKRCGYDKVEEAKKEHKVDDAITKDADNDTTNEDTVPFISHVNNIMHSVFSNFEVYVNNQQIYNSNGLYTHKSYISNNFKGQSLHTKEFFSAKVMTLKRILTNAKKHRWLNRF